MRGNPRAATHILGRAGKKGGRGRGGREGKREERKRRRQRGAEGRAPPPIPRIPPACRLLQWRGCVLRVRPAPPLLSPRLRGRKKKLLPPSPFEPAEHLGAEMPFHMARGRAGGHEKRTAGIISTRFGGSPPAPSTAPASTGLHQKLSVLVYPRVHTHTTQTHTLERTLGEKLSSGELDRRPPPLWTDAGRANSD